ncbi:hypothetical protein [Erwinia pyrifoliae]|uniref:Uncharacterized protein n=1 Tax=Erwinia pyrifoliae TaxID=79967 RepID=A0ABY5X7G9_ERWPY|nr:hypothetical protein [Erwinia pyrifoliae]UWS33147.1 hypothetical protein NYP84_16375 [Erwinia pyrifoliae]
MKRRFPRLILTVIALLLGWFPLRTPAHDAHHDDATCAAVVVPGPPNNAQDFTEKLRAVMVSENNAWSLKQVACDDRLGQLSIARYKPLSDGQKEKSAKNIDSCITAMQAA